MRNIITILLTCLFQLNLFAADNNLEQELGKLWKDGKITPEQPFAAKVLAAGGISPWSGVTHVYLQEICEKKRYCIAIIYLGAVEKVIEYKIIASMPAPNAKHFPFTKRGYNACLFTPALSIEKFVWIEPFQGRGVGKKFGKQDLIRMLIIQRHERQKKIEHILALSPLVPKWKY